MTLRDLVSNSKGKFLVSTVPTSANIEFGWGYETQVHPIEDGQPNFYKSVDYKHSVNSRTATENHDALVQKHKLL